jgi:hypothetical protein
MGLARPSRRFLFPKPRPRRACRHVENRLRRPTSPANVASISNLARFGVTGRNRMGGSSEASATRALAAGKMANRLSAFVRLDHDMPSTAVLGFRLI